MCGHGAFLALALWLPAALGTPQAAAQETDEDVRPTIGLVLSGGGARGAAHVGVIKVLEEMQIPVDYIAGTSMGAVVGGLYAAGMSAGELETVIDTADWSALLTDRPPRSRRTFRRKSDDDGFLVDFDIGVDKTGFVIPSGFFQGQNLEMALMRNTLPVFSFEHFDDLPIPFRAIATNIVSGDVVILDSGNLATAMRASMSAPGVFSPVRIQGRTLVDGGVVNNLPVQVARDMGADILIVVDVSSPLLPEEELESALGVTRQMLTILINARAQEQVESLTRADILITPDLGDFGAQEFQRLGEGVQIGAAKAREAAERLSALSVTPDQYRESRAQLAAGLEETPRIDRVVFENESRLSPEVIATRLSDPVGQTLDVDQLEADIADIYGFDTFGSVGYAVTDGADGNTLTIRSTAKPWGPNYLRFGINLEDDFDGNSNYNVAARLTRTEINAKGGELRAEIQLGESPAVSAEFFQPLDFSSHWFINPQFEVNRSSSGVFENGLQLAMLRSGTTALSLIGGRQFSNWGVFQIMQARTKTGSDLQIGSPVTDTDSIEFSSTSARFAFDTIDRLAVPRFGTTFSMNWSRVKQRAGAPIQFDAADMFFLKPQTWGNHTILHWWNLGTTIEENSPDLRPFSLGGLFNLSGYARDELAGRHYGIGRLLYYYKFGEEPLPLLDTSIYIGASLEAGNTWQSRSETSFDNTLVGGSVFVVFDTFLGPLYVAYGASEGGRRSAYLFLGQTF